MQKINKINICIVALSLLLIFSASLLAEPWGKDADLVQYGKDTCKTPSSSARCSPFSSWGIKAIRFHQEVISPADGPRSHFIPSSSQYALDAMRKYGFLQGVALGCHRLMRENDEPWVYRKVCDSAGKLMKWDPVP